MNTIKNYVKTTSKKVMVADSVLVLVSLALALGSFGMIAPNAHMLSEFNTLNATSYIQALGAIKLLGAILLWMPRTQRIALLVLTGYLGGAIMANITMNEFPAAPAVFLVLLWISLEIKTKDLLHICNYKK
jgi:hypothetical protein